MLNGFMLKTFMFQNQLTYHSFTMQIPIPLNCHALDISQIISIFKRMNSISQELQVKIYDPIHDKYIDLCSDEIADKTYLFSPVIMIKYKVLPPPPATPLIPMETEQNSSEEIHEKKERNKERSIREVLTCVKKWREIHNTFNKANQKINLQEAAKILGITKKSLDDYYSQLRLAEKYGFDFYRNIDRKIGVLRMFVKNHRQKDSLALKYDKLPKYLKVIQDFDPDVKVEESVKRQDAEIEIEKKETTEIKKQSNITEQQHKNANDDPEQEDTIIDSPPPTAIETHNQYEKCFYRSFNFMMDDPDNPFSRNPNPGRRKNTHAAITEQQFLLF